jgi:hypothetical protein
MKRKAGAADWRALYGKVSSQLADDAMNRGQPQALSFFQALGAEQGLEDTCRRDLVHAIARVDNLQVT